jgi:hypothetical protein
MPKRTVPAGPGKRIPLMSRTTKELRTALEEAASQSGRSLGQEVEYRLEMSFPKPRIVEGVGASAGTSEAIATTPEFEKTVAALIERAVETGVRAALEKARAE